VGLPFPRLLRLGILVIALHNAEEALAMPSWLEGRLPEVARRLGLGDVRAPPRDRLYLGLAVVTLVPALNLFGAARSRPGRPPIYAALAVIGLFLWNALVPHLALTAVLREYTPGVLTAALLTLPYGVLAYRRAVSQEFATRGKALGVLAGTAILYPLGMLLLWRPFALRGGTAAIVGCLACGGGGAAPAASGAPSGQGPAVLFIGNSLTSANGLPERSRRIAAAAGLEIQTSAVTMDGASLLDHWEAGRARDAIRSRPWSAVVLQQGPSTLPASREELTRLAGQFGEEIRRAGARPALLMVWPLPGQTPEAVSASYRAAAQATGALLIPAGDAWVRARAADPQVELTGPDGFHPSPLGTELAAATVVCSLYPAVRPVPVLPLPPGQRDVVTGAACEPGGP
jgi:hypothetical protein